MYLQNQLIVIKERQYSTEELIYQMLYAWGILVEKQRWVVLVLNFSNYCYLFSNNKFIRKELHLENTIVQNLS